jgi:hypothetical protein
VTANISRDAVRLRRREGINVPETISGANMAARNPYLIGNNAPALTEETITNLEVTGSLPLSLNGRYLRNGPNPISVPDSGTYHWFTGDGMIHGIRIEGGRASWYRNRWVRSGDVARALGEQRRPGPIVEGMDFAANTNVIAHAGRTYAIVEGGARPYELNYELETVGPCDFPSPGSLKVRVRQKSVLFPQLVVIVREVRDRAVCWSLQCKTLLMGLDRVTLFCNVTSLRLRVGPKSSLEICSGDHQCEI